MGKRGMSVRHYRRCRAVAILAIMAMRIAHAAGRAPHTRTHTGSNGSVLTTVSAVLVSLSLIPGFVGDGLLGAGHPRPLVLSALLMLVGRGLYLLFRHRS